MSPGVRWLRRLAALCYLLLILGGIGALAATGLIFWAIRDLPQVPSPLGRIIETPPTEIFAASGERVMLIGGREAVPLNQVAPSFIQAVIATEDHRFWTHHGVDKLRTLKALWITLFQRGRIQGASTITQQLAKNLFFSFERTWMRKFREMLVALQIESQYDKREILEAYVNQIPFGARAYGIEQAARIYFDKPASALTLGESALLAGLPKSPTRYNPYRHMDRARQRQQVVLQRMAATGYISAAQAEAEAAVPPTLRRGEDHLRSGSYFIDHVVRDLEARYGPEVVYHGGLQVTTTLDPHLQQMALEAVHEGLAQLDEVLGATEGPGQDPVQAALVAVETQTGAVRAMVGGRAYHETEYNRAVHNQRLPGSGFKPFVYYSALDILGLHPASAVVDRPVSIPVVGAADWRPRNFEGRHQGRMILKRALMRSVNSVAAQLVAQVGPQAVIQTARRCGITSDLAPVYSVALGTSGVSPLEMAGAFSTLATGGVRHAPFWIRRVEDARGRILDEHIVSGERTLDPVRTYQLVDMMRGVVDQGTAAVVRRKGFTLPAAGKTGTTNDYRDAWFTGFTPTLCASVWIGYDQQRPLRDARGAGITGGRGAAPIWTDFMRRATEGEPARDFTVPEQIRFELVDPIEGARLSVAGPHAVRVALGPGQHVSASDAPAATPPVLDDEGGEGEPGSSDGT
jgi:penicillin-binding protein 1A